MPATSTRKTYSPALLARTAVAAITAPKNTEFKKFAKSPTGVRHHDEVEKAVRATLKARGLTLTHDGIDTLTDEEITAIAKKVGISVIRAAQSTGVLKVQLEVLAATAE